MALLYNIVRRESPMDGAGRYYAQRVSAGVCTLADIAKEISEYAGQSEGTVYGLLVDLNNEMVTQLLNSYGIEMGNIGKLKLKFVHNGTVDTVDEVTADNVKECRIHYVPSATLKSQLDVDNTDVEFTYYPTNTKYA